MFYKLKPLDRIRGWLARRDHSRYELLIKIGNTFPELEDLETIIESLAQDGYLDEKRFALSRARHRAQQGYGPYRLSSELKEHRIAKDMIQQAIASVDWNEAWNIRLRKNTSQNRHAALAVRTGFPVSYAKENISED